MDSGYQKPKSEHSDGKRQARLAAKAFYKYLQEQGFKIQKIRMDGNCLFRSVAHQLTGNDQHYATYRELAVTHIKAHANFFQDFIDDDFDGGFPKYVEQMAKPGVWGGHLELMALSQVLTVKFCLITESKETLWVNMNADSNVEVLYLAYH